MPYLPTRLLLLGLLLTFTFAMATMASGGYVNPGISPAPRVISSRVKSLLAEMTLEQKVGQMTQLNIDLFTKTADPYSIDVDKALYYARNFFVGSILNSPTSSFGQAPNATQWVHMISDLQKIFLAEGAMIPVLYGIDSIHGASYIKGATLFPQQINAAASFNREISEIMGAITAKDTRVVGIPWTFSPVLDLATMPIWPRVYETFGEDPYVLSEMGAAIVKGYQGTNLSDKTKVAACMKHFIGYGNPRTGQDQNPSWIPDRFLYNYYLPSFQSAINAGAATVMESYQDLNGEAVCASKRYLRTLLREEMGFNGVLVTDWAEIQQLHKYHKIAATDKDAVRIAIGETSIDLSMVPSDTSFFTYLVELVNEGVIPESRIDESVARILQLKEDLGLFVAPMPDPNDPLLDTIGSREDRDEALQAARESIILAENRNGLLPLSLDKQKRVMTAGPSCDSLTYMTGGWSINWQGAPTDSLFQFGTTVVEGIQSKLEGSNVEFIQKRGCDINGNSDPNEFEDVVNTAKEVDVAILCVGETHYTELLGNIDDISLAEGQRNLIDAVASTGTPTVVVIFGGRPRVLGPAIDKVSAVLAAFLPGPEGGEAVADILYGKENPSARFPISYPKTTGVISQYWHKVTEAAKFQWEFGHGLSYSDFQYSSLQAGSSMRPGDELEISLKVRNNGPYPGMHSILLFVSDEYRQIVPEVKLLKRFEKISLGVGEEATIQFSLTVDDLSFYGIDNTKIYEEGSFIVTVGDLTHTFTLLP